MTISDDQSLRPVSVVIVDDEVHGRRFVRELIEKDDRFEVVAECDSGRGAIDWIRNNAVDVVFLDIEMPQVSGFEVLNSIEGVRPIVVIASAFSKYAVNAFEFEVFDYLTKPIDLDRFSRILNRVFRRRQERELIALQTLPDNSAIKKSSGADSRAKKSIHTNHGDVYFRDDEVHVLEAAGNYVKIQLAGESHLVRGSLANLLELLNEDFLIQTHRSYAVNIRYVRTASLRGASQAEVTMQDGDVIPVSRKRRKPVADLLQDFLALTSNGPS